MNDLQVLSVSRIRTLGFVLVSLGLLLASPAGARMSEEERCNWKVDKIEARFSKCLSRAATRLSNVLDGTTAEEDEHCNEQYDRSIAVLVRRGGFKDLGDECRARISQEGKNASKAAALVAAEPSDSSATKRDSRS